MNAYVLEIAYQYDDTWSWTLWGCNGVTAGTGKLLKELDSGSIEEDLELNEAVEAVKELCGITNFDTLLLFT